MELKTQNSKLKTNFIKRRKSKQIRVGNVKIGGESPISIQSMAKLETFRAKEVVQQIRALERNGCEIIRVAVKTIKDADAIKDIRRKINIPLVADIHFDYRLALKAIENGVNKIRLNPGNMRNNEEVAKVVKAAKKAKIPIRIGVNSGSVLNGRLVDSAMKYIKLFEELEFHDIIISIKASSVLTTVEAYKEIAKRCEYPLHLGVTSAGSYNYGIIKSSIGIGSLLLNGIGDTMRVSLTADPVEEVIAAKRILSSLGLRKFGPEIISCPTCGRCQVDLCEIVRDLERKLTTHNSQLKTQTIAVMGCEVNGPGEAKEADIGIAFGKDAGMLFKKGKVVKKVTVKNAIKELLKNL